MQLRSAILHTLNQETKSIVFHNSKKMWKTFYNTSFEFSRCVLIRIHRLVQDIIRSEYRSDSACVMGDTKPIVQQRTELFGQKLIEIEGPSSIGIKDTGSSSGPTN